MANNPSDNPLERLIDSAQANIPDKVLAQATQHMMENYPAPGSMSTTAQLTGQLLCGQCSALNVANAKFCRNCGSPLSAPAAGCPACKAPARPGDKFCSQCGSPLRS